MLRKLSPHEVEEKKTLIRLTNGRAFAGIHPRAIGIVLNLILAKPPRHA